MSIQRPSLYELESLSSLAIRLQEALKSYVIIEIEWINERYEVSLTAKSDGNIIAQADDRSWMTAVGLSLDILESKLNKK